MSELMSREETRELFNDLKDDFKNAISRIETKIDVATENINKYAKDTIEHRVKIENMEKDIDSIGDKVRNNQKDLKIVQKWHWSTSGAIAVIVFILNYFK